MSEVKVWTKEEWEEVAGGYQEEHYLVSAIRRHLLTPEQRQLLFEKDISIEDCLNGRIEGGTPSFVHEMYKAWNTTLGWHEFGF